MGIWVVVLVLIVGACAAAVLSHRRSDDVEPTVREFAEFRDAIGRQVAVISTAPRRRTPGTDPVLTTRRVSLFPSAVNRERNPECRRSAPPRSS